jgi:hypothetical protein
MSEKSDISLRLQTKSRSKPISFTKQRVIMGLVSGLSVTEASLDANVARGTVSGWLNRDPEFQAEYMSLVRRVCGQIEGKIAAGANRATDVLLDLLNNEDPRIRLAAAVRLLDFHRRMPLPIKAKPSEAHNLTIKELMESMESKIKNGLGGGI